MARPGHCAQQRRSIRRIWHASLDARMPLHLIAAFTSALARDEPVQRSMYDVPHTHLVAQEQRGPQSEQLAAEHEARPKAIRTAVRRGRRNTALTTRGGPPPAAVSSTAARIR
ncbi:DUF317 domain-containing protein [Streptomyces sp. PmtG]